MNSFGIPFRQWPPLIELLSPSCAWLLFIYSPHAWSRLALASIKVPVSEPSGWISSAAGALLLAMGVMAYALILVLQLPASWTGAILFPLMVLRLGQIQYIDRTRTLVSELRKKNLSVERNSDEISRINNGLLETLADLIDMRDPYVLGHSQQVTHYAVQMAETLNFEAQRVQLIRMLACCTTWASCIRVKFWPKQALSENESKSLRITPVGASL